MQEQSETFSVLVENRFGVLTRVAGLFSARGYNIDSLSVSPTENPDYSRMTIVTHGDADILEQIEKQLTKLIEVVKVIRLTQDGFLVSELMLVKVKIDSELERENLKHAAADLCAGVVQDSPDFIIFRVVGTAQALEQFIGKIPKGKILELARTGSVAIT